MKRFFIFLPLVLFFVVALIFHFSSPNIPDPDSFYHLGHARFYIQNGLASTDFPWMYYSVIRTSAADIWWGFHVFLIPFARFSGTLGIKLAGVLLTVAALASIYWLCRRHKLRWPLFWPLFIFISAPNILNRFLMTRPHLLSLALAAILFSLLIRGRLIWIFTAAAFLSWFHLSLFWLAIGLTGVVFAVRLMADRRWLWREFLAVTAGLALGWLARPNSIGALKLVYIQVFKLLTEKQQGLPLLFGRELFPLSTETLFKNFSVFMLLWLGAIVLMFWLYRRLMKNQTSNFKVLIFSSLILSLVFFVLTVTVARRSHDFWVLFGTIFMAAVFSPLLNDPVRSRQIKNTATAMIVSSAAFLVFYTPYRNSISLEERAVKPDRFKAAALWLKEHSQPGDIVFNLRWSDFPMLYFWNDTNYYIGGMDPIFQYAYDPALYWKFHYLSADEVTKKTCGAPACTAAMLEDTSEVLKQDFKAKYVVLEKQRNPLVYYYLESDVNHFEKVVDTGAEAAYRIK
ncbi:MAG: hypothetical protein HY454_00355 [Parcubacteria group bacterium]|nr:hypothetical protein [Parcubacteria group bacterium]